MSDKVQFDDEFYIKNYSPHRVGILEWLINKKVVKNKKQAIIFLIVIIIVSTILTIFF